MSIAAIASGIFAIAKAVPKVMELLNKLEKHLLDYRLAQITDSYTIKREKISAIVNSISRAETNEERRALSKILHDYTSGKFLD
jgi:hypothetical protein